jgi:DNA-binding MarR family transcriptional regulator
MTNKDKFIEEVENLITESGKNLSDEAYSYFESIKHKVGTEKLTENGTKVLKYMAENKDNFSNVFKAIDIGDGITMTGRAVSGAMRKLIESGYVKKDATTAPVTYSITDFGVEKALS